MKELATPFKEHLKETQALGINPSPLISFVQNQIEIQDDPLYGTFLQGELAFYSNDYKNALKYYLEAREAPDFQFYCYRASALLSHDIGHKVKALIFANKALKMHPEDGMTLKILNNLYVSNDEWEKAETIRIYMEKIEGSSGSPLLFGILSEVKNLAEQNLKDLHATGESSAEELFSWDAPLKEAESSMQLTHIKGKETLVANEILKEFIDKNESQDSFEERFSAYTLGSEKNRDLKAFEDSNLIDKLEDYSRRYQKHLEEYLNKVSTRSQCQNNCMLLLNTWNKDAGDLSLPTNSMNEYNDGLFIRFANKGIAINPGPRFLEALYKKNFSLLDIDYVIVTHSKREAFQDIASIYELSSELNRLLGMPHIIKFYINRMAYQEMIQILKPRYRQEKSALHCLEIYLDTPDIERIELQKEITLGYFLTSKSFNPLNPSDSLNLGIRLDLRDDNYERSIAYVSSSQWTPLLSHHIGGVDILVAGFGYTQKSDLERERYLDDALGYFGTLTLLQETPPKLAIITEFDKKVAGARLDIIKKLRENLENTTILPGDPGLNLDINDIMIQCSITKEWMPPYLAKIVQGVDPLSNLQYLSPSSYI